jgi:hypothetical protein
MSRYYPDFVSQSQDSYEGLALGTSLSYIGLLSESQFESPEFNMFHTAHATYPNHAVGPIMDTFSPAPAYGATTSAFLNKQGDYMYNPCVHITVPAILGDSTVASGVQ